MLVVFPPSLRREDGLMMTPSFYEDHLLERVSLLELRLVQVTEQLKMAYEFIKRESSRMEKDHLLLRSFLETIQKVNPDLAELLSDEFRELYNEKKDDLNKRNRTERDIRKILSRHGTKQTELFRHLIREGIRLFDENEEKQAFRTLEKAALLSPGNAALFLFIGKKYFIAEKFDSAREKLESAFETDVRNKDVVLLLGSIYADERRSGPARKLLSILASGEDTAGCVNLIWGMLAAFEKHWAESLAAFKEAASTVNDPEMIYLIGCAYYQLKNYESALANLDKAVAAEPDFADAWFMQSAVYHLLGDLEKHSETRAKAFKIKENGANCLDFMKNEKSSALRTALPFRHFRQENKRLLTKGSLRMRKFIRRKIFDSLN